MKQIFRIKDHKSIYIFSILIGVLSGLFSSVFAFLIHLAEGFTDKMTGGYFHSHIMNYETTQFEFLLKPELLLYILLPAFGGLLSGLTIYFFCQEASGMGTDSMIYSFHHEEGKMNPKVPLIKSIATIATLSSGGSGGKEGPISQIGAGLGAMLADLVGAGARARRTLLLAGTAGGLGAIFHAPLGGALTAAEMVYKEDVESDALVPCIISSSTAYMISELITPNTKVFSLNAKVNYNYKELPFYIALGIICYLGGKGFIHLFSAMQKFSDSLKIPSYLKPALGGFLVGLIAVFFPEVASTGDSFLQKNLNGTFHTTLGGGVLFPIFIFLLLFVLKIVTTSLTIGLGGSAGVFGPSLFAGSMLGGAMSQVAGIFLDPATISPVAYMMVGMGAFYSGIASAPIAGMLMVCEMVGNYELLPPLMVVTIISVILSNRFTIYKAQLLNRFSTPAHFWDMNQDIMDKIYMKDLKTFLRHHAILRVDTSIRKLEEKASEIHASDFIVVDHMYKYFGFASLRKITHLYETREFIADLVILQEVSDTSIPSISVNDSLKTAFHSLLDKDVDKIAVVNEENVVMGYLRIADLFRIYYKYIKK
ncbi:MAG: chloride channel protein [Leptospiraceae bacterium]|nr:chloride channel protein [Leptospiraceae bacterium]MCP5511525.1 chloride channel protein [Leptospiraceae bacterium]